MKNRKSETESTTLQVNKQKELQITGIWLLRGHLKREIQLTSQNKIYENQHRYDREQ